MFKIFTNSARETDHRENASFNLFHSIPSCVSKTRDLNSRLNAIADLLAQLPGLSGAIVIGCDATSLPIAYGTANFPLGDRDSIFSFLESLELRSREYDGWFSFQRKDVGILAGRFTKARKVEYSRKTIGVIAVRVGLASSRSALPGIDGALDHLAWAIKDGIRLEAGRISEDLQRLMLSDLGRLAPVRPQRIAERLQCILRADAVTILAREYGRLYLSGTTEDGLAEDKITYELGEGLTNQVLEGSQALRLRNARDEEEVRGQVALDFKASAEAEHREELAKSGEPFRLLAVPMRSGQAMEPGVPDRVEERDEAELKEAEGELSVRGVVRILRRQDSPPFSIDELTNLQRFADLLALALYAASWLHVTQRIIRADAEAICITRTEKEGDLSIRRIVYADPGAEKLFGLTGTEIIGRDACELYASSEEYERINTLLRESLRRGSKDEFGPIKARIKRVNGRTSEERLTKISYRFLMSPVAQLGVRYTLAMIRDITEDQHLSTLLDQKRLAYFRADLEGTTVETSGAESQITGYSIENLLKMNRRDLYLEPEDRDRLIAEVNKADGGLVEAREQLRKKNGESFWAEGVVHLLKDANGVKIGYEGLYEDVTERLKLQRYLDMDSDKLLEEGELHLKLKESAQWQLLLMTSLGHQLGSPLGALAENLKNFQKGVTDAHRFSEGIKHAIGQTRVCAQLVANLTYMDLLLRGETLDFRPVRLSKIAIETKLNFAHLAREKDLKILVRDEDIDTKLEVWGHEGLLRQVFVNLIDNAIKYSSPGSRIMIDAKEGVESNYLQVSNRGIGVPPGLREKIFFQGVRLKKARMAVPDGTGLGLWLVRRILVAHQAEIICDEVFEKGSLRTAFQIYFPSKPVKQNSAKWRVS